MTVLGGCERVKTVEHQIEVLMLCCLAPVQSLLAHEITTTARRYLQRKQKLQNIADPAQPRARKSKENGGS